MKFVLKQRHSGNCSMIGTVGSHLFVCAAHKSTWSLEETVDLSGLISEVKDLCICVKENEDLAGQLWRLVKSGVRAWSFGQSCVFAWGFVSFIFSSAALLLFRVDHHDHLAVWHQTLVSSWGPFRVICLAAVVKFGSNVASFFVLDARMLPWSAVWFCQWPVWHWPRWQLWLSRKKWGNCKKSRLFCVFLPECVFYPMFCVSKCCYFTSSKCFLHIYIIVNWFWWRLMRTCNQLLHIYVKMIWVRFLFWWFFTSVWLFCMVAYSFSLSIARIEVLFDLIFVWTYFPVHYNTPSWSSLTLHI